jgi:excisionase family DNA binding protein
MSTRSTNASRRLLSIPEVASLCGVSPTTVRRLIRAGKLSALRVGGQIRVAPAELRRYLADSQIDRRSQPGR